MNNLIKIIAFLALFGVAQAFPDVNLDKSLCRMKVGQVAELIGAETDMNPNPSICSLSANEFSELSGFAFDGSSMTNCYWSLEYDQENSHSYYGGYRYRGYHATCTLDGVEVVVQGWLYMTNYFGGGTDSYYTDAKVNLSYYMYAWDTATSTYHYKNHWREYPAPVSPDTITHTSPDPDWAFSYTISPVSGGTQIFSVTDPVAGSIDGVVSRTLDVGTEEWVQHLQSNWQYDYV